MRTAWLIIGTLSLAACTAADPVFPSFALVDLQGTLDGHEYRDSGGLATHSSDGSEWLTVAGGDDVHTVGMIVMELPSSLEGFFAGSADASADLCARTIHMPMEEVQDVPWTLRTKPTDTDGIVKVGLHAWTEAGGAGDAPELDLTATFFYDLDAGVPTPPL